MSSDPAMADGLNWYRYANNNPIMYRNPTGLEGEIVDNVMSALGSMADVAVRFGQAMDKERQAKERLEELREKHGLKSEEEFAAMSGDEQREYLQEIEGLYPEHKDENGEEIEDYNRGALAMYARSLRPHMKLKEMFGGKGSDEEILMDGQIRDFLNLNYDGTNNYSEEDMILMGFERISWPGDSMHQKTAVGNSSAKRNHKYVHADGREVVFSMGKVVKNYPDKGTFNYAMNYKSITGDHKAYDMDAYKRGMKRRA